MVYDNLGKYQEAISDYKRAIQGNYRKDLAFNNIGWVYVNLGNYKTAIANFNEAIAINGNFAMAYNNRGVAYQLLGQTQKAIADYKKALKIDPDFELASNNLAAFNQQNRYPYPDNGLSQTEIILRQAEEHQRWRDEKDRQDQIMRQNYCISNPRNSGC